MSYLSDCFVFDSCFSIGMGTFVLGKIIWRVNIESDKIFPETFYIREFYTCNSEFRFAKNIGNSLIIAIITTGIAIVISSMAAYGIVRFFPKLGSIMSKVLVATYMFPPILLAIPYSMVMAKLGLVNTRIGLIIVYLSFSVPYAVWMLVGFLKRFHWELKKQQK